MLYYAMSFFSLGDCDQWKGVCMFEARLIFFQYATKTTATRRTTQACFSSWVSSFRTKRDAFADVIPRVVLMKSFGGWDVCTFFVLVFLNFGNPMDAYCSTRSCFSFSLPSLVVSTTSVIHPSDFDLFFLFSPADSFGEILFLFFARKFIFETFHVFLFLLMLEWV